ncbi:flavodoxin domain-containing protein [Phytomonospora sp. NPDC050363]|uniref:flavodoxin domain-containing protein n=1 Tax=Phytomonospora sp. NPDC050363 TaxID=3155642 RepID=UPI0033D1D084
MTAEVLVAYATLHGSTRDIAERIAAAMPNSGIRALPTDDVGEPCAYILGSAVYRGAWLPEALDFLEKHREKLARRPVWTFSVGMPGALARRARPLAMSEAPKIVEAFPSTIQLRDHHLFTGVVNAMDSIRPLSAEHRDLHQHPICR